MEREAAAGAKLAPITSGVSQEIDPVAAADEFYRDIWRPGIDTALFFCSPHYELAAIEQALNERFRGVRLVGCTTAGEITPRGYLQGAITGIGFDADHFTVVAERITDLRHFSIAHGAKVVQSALLALDEKRPARRPGTTFAFLLIDGMSGSEETVVSAIYGELDEIPLFGGSAASGLDFSHTHVFHEGLFREDCAVLLLVHTDFPFRIFKTDHFISIGPKMVVTGADPERRIVTEIDSEPAALAYARAVGLGGQPLTPMIFAAHPVVVRVGGQYHVRAIQKVNNDQSLSFMCAIDEGIVLTIAEGGDLVRNLEELLDGLEAELGPVQVVLGCDCILRRLEIEQTQAMRRVSELFRRHHVIGFSTYGEQINSMHVNQTFTGVAIGFASPRP